MSNQPDDRTPAEIVRPLVGTRQYRDFTDEPPMDAQLRAILETARWTGSSQNSQPWRFIAVRDVPTIRAMASAGQRLTRSLQTATAAVAIALPDDRERATALAYDDGRAAERILVAASMLGLGGGIAWLKGDAREAVRDLLGIPAGWLVRTVVALGHPSATARAPKSAPGQARLQREQVIFEERWPKG